MLQHAALPPRRRGDLLSGISRMCSMLACRPEALKLDIPDLRARIGGIRPAAHKMSEKSFSNVRWAFGAALQFAGVIDGLGRGDAKHDPRWSSLVKAIAHDARMAN